MNSESRKHSTKETNPGLCITISGGSSKKVSISCTSIGKDGNLETVSISNASDAQLKAFCHETEDILWPT